MRLDKDWKKLAVIVLFITLVNLFFINKAIHIDDIAFIKLARHINEDLFDPYSFHIDYGTRSGIATIITDPPLVPYYYSIFIKYFGESETILHAAFLFFTLMAAISMYYVAKRFTKKPLSATFLMIVTPIFFLMSHNLMVDIPTLGFFLAALITYIYGVDKDNYAMIFIASILIIFGIFTKYTNLVLIPLLGFYSILKRKYKSMLFLIIPLAVVLLWNYYTITLYGSSHIGFVTSYVYTALMGMVFPFFVRFLNVITNLGGAVLFPLFLVYPFISKRKNKIAYFISILAALLMSVGLYFYSGGFVSGRYGLLQLVLFFIFVSSGLFIFYLFLDYSKKDVCLFLKSFFRKNKLKFDSDNVFLFVWFIGIAAFNVLLISYASRYIMLLIPVFIILYVKILSEKFQKVSRELFTYCIAFTFLLSLLMAISDYQLAGSYRNFANTNVFPDNIKIWYNGAHGFQYYMEKKGYKMMPKEGSELKQGDLIFKSTLQVPRPIPADLNERIKLIDKIQFENNFPIRIFNINAHAGFYSYGAGFLPFSISTADFDTIEVYEVLE